jgi:deazaflavin-dependent oxidoreductase (nitroreductase family)
MPYTGGKGAMAPTAKNAGVGRTRRGSVGQPLRTLIRLFNPLALTIAGGRIVRFWVVIRHRGRRSGRVYATPVAAARANDGFVIPLPFGEGVDWCRNVRAAGRCVVRWNSVEHDVGEPEVIDASVAVPLFHPIERVLLRLFGIERFLRLR